MFLFPSDLTEYHVNNSVLALVDGELWPLHQPLTQSCSLTLLTFKDNDPTQVNQVHWQKVVVCYKTLLNSLDCQLKKILEYLSLWASDICLVLPGLLAFVCCFTGSGVGDCIQGHLHCGAAQYTWGSRYRTVFVEPGHLGYRP